MMNSDDYAETYAVGSVARLTGVSPDVLRAWERRYGAVQPLRTPGGTRRYRPSDIERLQLLKAAVDAGHRIGEVARLSPAELASRVATRTDPGRAPIEETLASLNRLDGDAAERQISAQLAALGPVRFATEFAIPLLAAIGDGWAEKRVCVASEHLGSALLRSLLGTSLRPTAAHRDAPVVVFGTLPGERHELGLLIAALAALGAGASPLYLGPDLPVDELAAAAKAAGARALAVSAVGGSPEALASQVSSLRRALDPTIELWVGGRAGGKLPDLAGVRFLDSLDRLERRVGLLRISGGRA